MNLEQSIMDLKGIGEKNAALFHKLNIDSIEELLYHFPREYERFPVAGNLQKTGSAGEKTAVLAVVVTAPSVRRARGLSLLTFQIEDENRQRASVTFFHMPYLKNTIKTGKQYVFYGPCMQKDGTWKLAHPKMYAPDAYRELEGTLMPVYAKTKGLTNQTIRKYCLQALKQLDDMEEYLPAELVTKYRFPSPKQALVSLHAPTDMAEATEARKRFSYEEFLLFLLAVRMEKAGQNRPGVEMIETADANRLISRLPYELTDSQKEAFRQIKEDMLGGMCMNRLLQGDVGSGKTIVAVLALLLCISNGYQGAMMAPTEVLAKQHMETVLALTKQYDLPFRPVLLVGSQTAREKKEIYRKIEDETYNLVIGTHAIIQQPVTFSHLALVVTDEQHRFGVKQREKLVSKSKEAGVHTIVMSATPIPRSLALILYGDLALTEMKELPSGRLPIKNCVVNQNYRPAAYRFMAEEIEKGHQVFVICPMAEPGVMEELENVVEYAGRLREEFPKDVQIAYLHGKMKPKQKNEIMERFAEGAIDILVSTTVIEVGINVPNATVMLVENAERFGLATLHQIRGRVGRGKSQAYCIFMETQERPEANERLSILVRSNDGFEIASEDLKLRGPGDLTGIEQSGSFRFRFADIYRDASLLKSAAEDVAQILKNDSLLLDNSHIPLKRKLEQYVTNGYLNIL